LGRTPACLLTALAANEWLDGSELVARAREIAAARCWPLFERHSSLHQFILKIRDRVVVRRRGRRPSLYHIAPSALVARATPSAVTPIRGVNLCADVRFAAFERRGFSLPAVDAGAERKTA
jgi:hypothetical protein